jgi:hypothetical protein
VEDAGIHYGVKVQPPPAGKGHFAEDRFAIDLQAGTVTCPANVTVPILAATGRHVGTARFGAACRVCPLAAPCTTAHEGRTITAGPQDRPPDAPPPRQAPTRVRGQLKVAAGTGQRARYPSRTVIERG